MNSAERSEFRDLTDEQMLRVNRVCDVFESQWRSGGAASIEAALEALDLDLRPAALGELLPMEIEYRRRAGSSPTLDEYLRRFPTFDRRRLESWFGAARRSADDESRPPEKLGDYQILERIGRGGMGAVYKAMHERMGRIVALKVLRPEIQRDPALLRRFDREVRAAARLNHPNIVAALDAREQDGVHFLITEYVDGGDLDDAVRRGGPLSVAAAVHAVLQAARGLDYAHRQGVVHRDVKPANLLRDSHGVVKVLDMGLARIDALDEPGGSELTQSGVVMGTAAYMAPEQARDTRKADARSDVYSLGCTLYYLLAGRPAFSGETMVDTILSHVSQPIPSLARTVPGVPASLDAIFRRMVAKEPAERYPTAAAVVEALESLELPPTPVDAGAHAVADTGASPAEPLDASKPGAAAQSLDLDFSVGGTRADGTAGAAGTDGGAAGSTVAVDAEPVRRGLGETPAGVPPAARRSPVRTARGIDRRRAVLAIGGAAAALGLAAFAGRRFFFGGAAGGAGGAGRPGVGLTFDGATAYVEAPDVTPEAGADYTIEAIVRATQFRTSNVVSWLGPDWMAVYLTSDGRWGVARRFAGEPHLRQMSGPAELDRFYHLTGVFAGAELRLFVDGREVDWQETEYGLPETTGGLFLGGVPLDRLPEGQNDRFFAGEIDAVRISRGVRYQADFSPPAELTSDASTLVLFGLNEGKGATTTGGGERRRVGRIEQAVWTDRSGRS